jgi:hypothetical protein
MPIISATARAVAVTVETVRTSSPGVIEDGALMLAAVVMKGLNHGRLGDSIDSGARQQLLIEHVKIELPKYI